MTTPRWGWMLAVGVTAVLGRGCTDSSVDGRRVGMLRQARVIVGALRRVAHPVLSTKLQRSRILGGPELTERGTLALDVTEVDPKSPDSGFLYNVMRWELDLSNAQHEVVHVVVDPYDAGTEDEPSLPVVVKRPPEWRTGRTGPPQWSADGRLVGQAHYQLRPDSNREREEGDVWTDVPTEAWFWLWDATTGKALGRHQCLVVGYCDFTAWLFGYWEDYVINTSVNGTHLWRYRSNEQFYARKRGSTEEKLPLMETTYRGVALGSPHVAVAGDNHFGVYDLRNGKVRMRSFASSAYVWDVALAPDGSTMAVARDEPDSLTTWSVPELEPLDRWENDHTTYRAESRTKRNDEFTATLLSPDGKLIAMVYTASVTLIHRGSKEMLHLVPVPFVQHRASGEIERWVRLLVHTPSGIMDADPEVLPFVSWMLDDPPRCPARPHAGGCLDGQGDPLPAPQPGRRQPGLLASFLRGERLPDTPPHRPGRESDAGPVKTYPIPFESPPRTLPK